MRPFGQRLEPALSVAFEPQKNRLAAHAKIFSVTV